jgi:processing peptidase subunit beta
MGASLNAYTSREHTIFFIKAFKNDISKAVEILADIVQNSEYRHEDIQYERNVVLREMTEVNRKVEELAMDHLHELAFQNSSLGYTILGPEHNIRSFDRNQILEYVGTHYRPERMLLVGAGAVEPSHLENLAQTYFAPRPDLPPFEDLGYEKPAWNGAARVVEEDVNKDNYCVVAFEGASWASEYMIPLLIIQTLIGTYDRALGTGANVASDLASVMERYNLCEKYSSFVTSYNPTGLVGVNFSTKGRAPLDGALREVLSEYVRLAHNAQRDEVERAKNRLKTSLALANDGLMPVCEDIGRQILTIGRRVPLSEFFDRIDAVDHNTVRDVCAQLFTDAKPAVVAVGKKGKISLPDYSKICDWTAW